MVIAQSAPDAGLQDLLRVRPRLSHSVWELGFEHGSFGHHGYWRGRQGVWGCICKVGVLEVGVAQ